MEKFGGDTLDEMRANHEAYLGTIGPRQAAGHGG
jgi:hypothetical protein